MTIDEIKSSDKPFLLAVDIAGILGCDAHAIRIAAHNSPEHLGFPVTVMGTRVRIPRLPFLAWLGESV